MKKITLVTGLCLALLVPAVALAKVTPNAGDKRAAKSECSMWRGHSHATREAFQTKFETFKACVKKKASEEAREAKNAHTNAAKECKALREQDPTGFADTYGTSGDQGQSKSNSEERRANGEGRNAFGKCVSQKAKAKEKRADAKDRQEATEFKSAAESCDDERSQGEAAFNTKWGESASDADAFGNCVSRTAQGLGPETQQPASSS